MSSLDIVCFYADLGRPYLDLIRNMTASAKRAMPHARTVLLTPTPTHVLGQCFDKMVNLSGQLEGTADTLCIDRVRATVSWQALTKNRTIYADPDVEFHREIPFDGSFDVGLLWRARKPDQPINTGIVLAEPGSPDFWSHYGAVAVNLPKPVHSWWCDQLAYNVILGTLHQPGDMVQAYDARVRLFSMTDHCTPREKATTDNPWAWHDKGRRKWRLAA
jgi:hypothetical protein